MKINLQSAIKSSSTKRPASAKSARVAPIEVDESPKKITASVAKKTGNIKSKLRGLIDGALSQKQTCEEQLFSQLRDGFKKEQDVVTVQDNLRPLFPKLAMSRETEIQDFVQLLKTVTLKEQGFYIACMRMVTSLKASYPNNKDIDAILLDEKILQAVADATKKLSKSLTAYKVKGDIRFFSLFFSQYRSENPLNAIDLLIRGIDTPLSEKKKENLQKTVCQEIKQRKLINQNAIRDCAKSQYKIQELYEENKFSKNLEEIVRNIKNIENEVKNIEDKTHKKTFKSYLKNQIKDTLKEITERVKTYLKRKEPLKKTSSPEYLSKLISAYKSISKEKNLPRCVKDAEKHLKSLQSTTQGQ